MSESCSTAEEIVSRIMTSHWDMAACRCWVCTRGRDLGIHPVEKYLDGDNRTLFPVPETGWGDQ